MKNRWTDEGARAAIDRWGAAHGEALALRVYTGRLIGEDPELVLHGGGNVSLKSEVVTRTGERRRALRIKGSGGDLAVLEPAGLVAVDLERVLELRALDALDDLEVVNEQRCRMHDAAAPNPSIETLVHAVLPHAYVDHSHADALLALTNVGGGEALVRETLGDGVAIVPYTFPGFELSKAVAAAYAAHPEATAIVLMQHGLITFGATARESYDRHVAIVEACERRAGWSGGRGRVAVPPGGAAGAEAAAARAALVAPILRGLLATGADENGRPTHAPVLEWLGDEATVALASAPEMAELAATGPLTTDHLIRTKARPVYVAEPPWDGGEAALRARLAEAVTAFRRAQGDYVTAHLDRVARPELRERARAVDPSPRVVVLPGAGVFCWGPTKRDARIAADVTAHTLAAKQRARTVGAWRDLAPHHLFDMEFRPLQLAKLGERPARALDGKVVVVSGGAGAIGAGIAEACAEAGAHVVVTDVDRARVERVAAGLGERYGAGTAAALRMDVTDEASVADGFAAVARRFGGVDCIVPNAGIAHVSPLADLDVAKFRQVLEVNLVGTMLFLREGARLLERQGTGGNVVVISSKNVFGPGKDFGAYSASKAGGHQLGRIAAIELAPLGVRVNMITPDAVFGDAETPSGLWAEVGPDRAARRGLATDDLPEYYRQRNLLKARVLARHVGNAVVFFASNATPTTGAVLPVDGGVVDAFPR